MSDTDTDTHTTTHTDTHTTTDGGPHTAADTADTGTGTGTDTGTPRYAPEWLALREGADAAARAPGLLGPLRAHWADQPGETAELVIRDLGCGTGSMGRWLAPRLPGPQHWILHDHDPDLLVRAAASMPRTADDGSRVTAATERGDIARLTSATLAGTSLVTGSALLDLLTRDEVDALAAACAGAGCPALLALSVAGRVELTPAEPLDAEIAEAFNAHQRRVEHGRRLLGPDAIEAASEAFARHGMEVRVRASPWRLGAVPSLSVAEGAVSGAGGSQAEVGGAAQGAPPTPPGQWGSRRPTTTPETRMPETRMPETRVPETRMPDTATPWRNSAHAALAAQWLRGWVGAAVEQRPELAPRAEAYLTRRLTDCPDGGLTAVVHHSDILALPVGTTPRREGDPAAGPAGGAR
ncbi:class I SAM-dependent methyltransferase [Streptomyces corynorhini]|uniref:class I SAM-dependent methyltransferase n=1 Tax=Streptomyces corynorhini TaxID=2282652 RepID=UPI001F48EC9B|nr:class I SAM-dependent methyltransferase [Streptomyces corynorhini]